MKTILRAAASAGVGGIFAVGMNATMDAALLNNTTEADTHVDRCAASLGEAAMYSAVLPKTCEEFALYLDTKTVKVKVTNFEGGRAGTQDNVEFALPSADEFRREFGPTESSAEINERIKRMNGWVSSGLGTLLGVSLFLLPHASKLNKGSFRQFPDIRREPYRT